MMMRTQLPPQKLSRSAFGFTISRSSVKRLFQPSSVSTPTTGQNLSIYQPSATAGKQSTIPIIGLKGSVTEIGEDNEVIPVYRRLNSLKTDPRKHTERKRDFFAMSTGGNRIADASFIVQKGRAGSPAAETTDPMKDYYAARVVVRLVLYQLDLVLIPIRSSIHSTSRIEPLRTAI